MSQVGVQWFKREYEFFRERKVVCTIDPGVDWVDKGELDFVHRGQPVMFEINMDCS